MISIAPSASFSKWVPSTPLLISRWQSGSMSASIRESARCRSSSVERLWVEKDMSPPIPPPVSETIRRGTSA